MYSLVMQETDFIEIFVNNEAQTPVYYDNMQVVMRGGSVMDIYAYYPFGTQINYLAGCMCLDDYNFYTYNGKESGPYGYDFGARLYDATVMRWWVPDPLAENHYNISPYAYCANNPINFIDPDGLDWYEDDLGRLQFDPLLNEENKNERLKKGQKYAGQTPEFKGKDKKTVVGMGREDGSIMYTDETAAYNRMWEQANRKEFGEKGREVFGIITENGVLVLPVYKNDYGSADTKQYGYHFKNEQYTDPVTGESLSYVATIHTHQDKTNPNPNLSMYEEYGDEYIAVHRTPNKPMVVMGWNDKLYGIIANPNNASYLSSSFKERNYTVNSLLNGTKLTKFLLKVSVGVK